METILVTNRAERLPWKIIYQNIQRLVTMNKKEKVQFMKDYTKEERILLINFTKTWLDESIQDDPKIEGYVLHRGDRKGRIGGGTAIYVKEEYESQIVAKMSTGSVEMVAVYIEKLNILNIAIYRPPDALKHSFSEILKNVKKILRNTRTPEPTIIITGDFNFPFLKWKRDINGGCIWEIKKVVATRDEKNQFEILNAAMDDFGLIQTIEEPTRLKNTLDLVYTNEVSMFSHVEVLKSCMSDHDRIELTTNIKSNESHIVSCVNQNNENCLRKLNFNFESIEWEEMNKELEEIQWIEVFKEKDTELCLEFLMEVIMNLCKKYIPEKKARNRSIIPKRRKKLFNKIKKLRRSKQRATNRKKEEINRKILEVEREIILNKREERAFNERKVIDNIDNKPKLFYGYIKNKEKRENKIGPFKLDGDYVTENRDICETMVKQYNAQYSNNKNKNNVSDNIFIDIQADDITDIQISYEDIQNAIGAMDTNSTAGPDGIPAKLLIKTKEKIAMPLQIIMRKSIDEGVIPSILKLAHVAPIHK